MTVLLKDAFKPNLVQTLENTPAIIHGGPFANIAHGCNSIIATKMGLKLADYCVTEAGFGADLGAEKFLDIKCRNLAKSPDVVVCVATIKALKYHGGMPLEDLKKQESIEYLEKGVHNLLKHIENLKDVFGLNVIVAINKYTTDTNKEIEYLKKKVEEKGVAISLVEAWGKGGKGSVDLAKKIVDLCNKKSSFNYCYELNDKIKDKIEKVATKIYGAEGVDYTKEALEIIANLEKKGYGKIPVCIAKTQYSLSDDSKNLLCDKPFKIHVRDVILKSGAEFIVVITGNIFTMPGLPKIPTAETIDLNKKGEIVGIF